MKLELARGLSHKAKEIRASAVFGRWLHTVGGESWPGTITIVDVDAWGGQIHALSVRLQQDGAPWPNRAILRSATVDVRVRITDGQSEPVLLFVSQQRDAVGQQVISNPAGGIDWGDSPWNAARREVAEETHLPDAVLERGELALLVNRPVIVSPGITNELAYLFAFDLVMTPDELAQYLRYIETHTTGLAQEGEVIKVFPVPQHQARAMIVANEPDAKTLLSLALSGI